MIVQPTDLARTLKSLTLLRPLHVTNAQSEITNPNTHSCNEQENICPYVMPYILDIRGNYFKMS